MPKFVYRSQKNGAIFKSEKPLKNKDLVLISENGQMKIRNMKMNSNKISKK